MSNEVLEPLALRFPAPYPNCPCPICNRTLWPDSQRAIRDNIPSVFQRHKLVRQAPYLPQPAPGATPAPLPKRIPIYDYDMTDADYTAFAQQYATNTLHTLPPSSQEQPWIKAALKVTRQLVKLKVAAPFLVPVDPVQLQLPDYWDVVKHPMDLTTVERKLLEEPSPYTEPAQWESDMRQIFHNAYLCQHYTPQHNMRQNSVPLTLLLASRSHALAKRPCGGRLTDVVAVFVCACDVRQQAGAFCGHCCTRLFDQVRNSVTSNMKLRYRYTGTRSALSSTMFDTPRGIST